jgi:trk system potassium uptake protein TrkA
MDVVIMGGGRVGLNLASFLISDGHDITLIENNEEKCHNIAPELDATIICGNGTDINILEESDIEDADVFVAATGNDESNLLACILANDLKVPKIISRVTDPNHKEAFKKVGINIVINPELTAASYVEKLIIRPKIADLAVIGEGDAELLDFKLEEGDFVGKKIGEVSPTDNFIIVAVYSNGDITIPKPDMILTPGIKISILVKTKFAKDVMKRFTKEVTIYDTIPTINGNLNRNSSD